MPTSMSPASVPLFLHMAGDLSIVLKNGEAYTAENNVSPGCCSTPGCFLPSGR